MRVLYVALTRAKEKLILTGIEKDYKKSIEKKEELLNSYKESDKNGKINKNIVQRYISYLDWIELVYIKCKKELDEILTVKTYKKPELLKNVLEKEEQKERSLEEKLKNIDEKHKEEIKAKLDWEYGYKMLEKVLTKTSVTAIKNMKLDLEEEKGANYKVPEFMKEEKKLTSTEKGTLMHMSLQKLDITIDYDKKEIEKLADSLLERNIINKMQREAVDIEKIYKFTKTDIWRNLKTAKKVERERPFYITIPAKEIYGEDIEEEILVQGIIDLYYITDKDELVLVDYKTDRVREEAELISKYNEQLKLYKEALERALGRKVDKVIIYSSYLDDEIII